MRLIDLIRDYERTKTIHQPLSDSLGQKLVQIRDVFGSLPADVSGDKIAEIAQKRWGGGAQGTVKRQLVQVRAILNHARDRSLIDKSPKIAMPTVNDARVVDISAQQAESILDLIELARTGDYPLALLLTHTGGRLGEVLALKGDDFGPDWVIYRKPVARRTKTVTRMVPLSRRVRDSCAAYDLVPPRGVTLAAHLGYRSRVHASLKLGAVLSNACEQLDLPRLRVHDLRHVFAAILAENGADLADIATLLGHLNLSTSLRYRGLVRAKAQRLVNLI